MKIIDIKNNNGFISLLTFTKKRNLVKGFTLVETMFAVFILTFAISALMNIVSSSIFSARYAKDEITANYLLQEVVDYIRNDRDTIVFLGTVDPTNKWEQFWNKYQICSATVSPNGCSIEAYSMTLQGLAEPQNCLDPECGTLYFNSNPTGNKPFYTHDKNVSGVVKTNYKRTIYVERNGNEINVTVNLSWKNGGLSRSRSLKTSFLNWQQI